jgi:hypothetical protein
MTYKFSLCSACNDWEQKSIDQIGQNRVSRKLNVHKKNYNKFMHIYGYKRKQKSQVIKFAQSFEVKSKN